MGSCTGIPGPPIELPVSAPLQPPRSKAKEISLLDLDDCEWLPGICKWLWWWCWGNRGRSTHPSAIRTPWVLWEVQSWDKDGCGEQSLSPEDGCGTDSCAYWIVPM